jgi:uncharacterized protein (DUF1330 family)
MSAYLIADIKVTNDGWVPEYAASVHEFVHKHGGKYLSRSDNVKTVEGKPLETSLIAIMQFPTAQHAMAFVKNPVYAPFVAACQKGSESRFQPIDDTDLAGTLSTCPRDDGGRRRDPGPVGTRQPEGSHLPLPISFPSLNPSARHLEWSHTKASLAFPRHLSRSKAA